MVEIHTYIFHHGDCQNLIGHCHVSWGWHSIVDLQLHNREIKKNCQREQTWIINEAADCRSHRSGRNNVVPEKLQQFAVTLRIQNQSSGELFMTDYKFVSFCVHPYVRAHEILQVFFYHCIKCCSGGCKHSDWSRLVQQRCQRSFLQWAQIVQFDQFRNLRTRSSCTRMCY